MEALQPVLDSLKPLLQPITHNLPAPIADFGKDLIGQKCYQTLLLDIDLTQSNSQDCLKLAISKALGIGIIAASSVVKVPQLIKLLKSQSSEGISFLSYLLETSSYAISLAYNVRQGFPFSTYGETSLIALQNIAIAALVLHFGGKSAGAAAWVAGIASAGYALFNNDIVDMKTLSLLQAGAGVLGVASKLPQIVTVFMEGTTGQLSAFAVFNYLLGSLTRIFTTLQEVDDPLILYGFVAAFALNLVLAAQMVYYWNSPGAKKTVKTGKGKTPKIMVDDKPVESVGMGTGVSRSRSPKGPSTRRRG